MKLVPFDQIQLPKSVLRFPKRKFSEPGYKPATEFTRRSKAASQAGLAEIQKRKWPGKEKG